MVSNIAFEIFGVKVFWYGIVYFFGFLISYFLFIRLDKTLKAKKEDLENLFLGVCIFGLIGGRVFHIVFYDLLYYIRNPIEIVMINKGGMSIFGGIFFGILSIRYFSKKYKLDYLKILDFVSILLPLFLSFGRIANHLNREIVGVITDKFGVIYENKDMNLRYPVVLFESFFYQIIFGINFVLYNFFSFRKGVIFINFVLLYSIIRFFLEFLKESDKIFLNLNMSQIFCIIFLGYGIYMIFKVFKIKVRK